jgi:tetratricopeptide (TPR) repeat protein
LAKERVRLWVVAIVWAGLGIALYRRNAVWESPTALWADVVAKRPANGRAHVALATIHQGRSELSDALREYGLALQGMENGKVEDRLVAMEGMAAALVDTGRFREALTVIRAALALKPGNPTMLATLAAAELRAGNLEEAERVCQEVLSVQPRQSGALLTLGEAKLLLGDAAGAAHYLARAVEAEPNEPIRLLEYGRTAAQLGQRERACQSWRTAARSSEARDDDRRSAAELLAGLGCASEASARSTE